ncbi:glycosyltransferase [Haloglomus litoreum]|uniref:glycosyltransferase n=1 Tax=Haloglomus litoreum TaxID=3034026 RepID=UPI0023E7D100|nr:glycosyltransferase [Haloglomus sp. DT116]
MTATGDDRTQVWYLIGTLAVGGTERTLVDLVNGLDRDRFPPMIWTITEPGPLADDVAADVPVRSLGAASKIDPRPALRLGRELRRERPAVLQSFLYFDNVLARLVGQVSPETTVVTGVREVPESLPLHRDLVDRATLGLSDHVVSNSEAGAEWVRGRGVDPEQVSVVRNGRDVDAYDVQEPEGLRAELGLGDGPVVGTVGRLVERKGHHDLLDAWPAVLAAHPDAELVLVGDGPERDALRTHAGRLGIESSVHLLGRRDDVPELLALFDLFAFPSHYEGLPGALLEAMCAGLPIVTTPVDGCAELVADGEHGVHVPPRDPAALGAAIEDLLAADERAATLGRTAARRARDEFSIAAMVDEFGRLYGKL